jgi:hypothetical protein
MMNKMRFLSLSVVGLLGLVALVALSPKTAVAQPGAIALNQMTAGAVEQVGYRYRRYRYARRPYYSPYYRPYYQPYAYYRPYYQPYYRPYYRPYAYYRPGVNIWLGY